MFPDIEKKIEKWSKSPRPPEKLYPFWLLQCKCIVCRNGRRDLGLERRESSGPEEKNKE